MTTKVNSHTVKIHRGRTDRTQEIIRYKDTYVLDGWYLCILRELVETEEDYYWVLQCVANESIYMLTGVTSPIYLQGKVEDWGYNSIYVYHREKLDRQWEEWKSKVIQE